MKEATCVIVGSRFMDRAQIEEGQRLITLLDATPAKPRGAVWVSGPGPRWRLWVVPAEGMSLQEFDMIAAGTIAANSGRFLLIDTQCVVPRPADDPAIQGMKMMVRMEGLGDTTMTGCTFNGVAIPECVILRLQF